MSSKTRGQGISVLAHALLGLLAARPLSGYDVMRTFDGSLGFVWMASHAQIYPELAVLAEAGFVAQGEAEARGRRVYTLTEAGRSELHRWLVETEPTRQIRNEALLRTFFAWVLTPAEARTYFEKLEASARSALAQYEAVARVLEESTPEEVAARVALESGLRQMSAVADWATWAAERYRAEDTTLND
jgi:PadR family transcriptional regulator AphA